MFVTRNNVPGLLDIHCLGGWKWKDCDCSNYIIDQRLEIKITYVWAKTDKNSTKDDVVLKKALALETLLETERCWAI